MPPKKRGRGKTKPSQPSSKRARTTSTSAQPTTTAGASSSAQDIESLLTAQDEQSTGPEAEFSSQERIKLIEAIAAKVSPAEIDQRLWAFLWFADIEMLEKLLEKNSDLLTHLYGLVYQIEKSKILLRWTQRTRERTSSMASSPELPSTPTAQSARVSELQEMSGGPTSSPKTTASVQSKLAAESCRFRDESRCVLTGADDPVDVAHIFPVSMSKFQSEDAVKDQFNPWNVLRHFWTESKVNAWYTAITSLDGTETLRNLMCLAPHVHRYHGRAYFALEPVEEKRPVEEEKQPVEDTLTARFHWLPHMMKLPRRPVQDRPFFTRGIGCGRRIRLWNVDSGEEILSGMEIQMRARCGRPLPDPALLQLQWILQRVIALAGGAEAIEESYTDDDDDCAGQSCFASDEDEDFTAFD